MGIIGKIREEFSILKGNYLLLIVTWILMDFFMEIPSSFFELYVLELGGTVVIIGLINFSLKIAFASVSFPGGYIADKFGRKGIIIFSTLAMGFNFMIFAFAPDWRFLLLAMVTGNLLRISNPALQALTADSLPPKKRGVGYSIQQIMIDLTSTPAPLVAGLLFASLGFVNGMRIAYLGVSLTYFIAGIIRYRLTETLENAEKVKVKEILKAFPLSYVESLKMLYTVPKALRSLIIGNNIFNFGFSLTFSYIIIYATTELGLSKIEWSVLLTAQAALAIVLMMPLGKMTDKYGGRKTIIIFSLASAICLALIVVGNFYILLIAVPILGLAGGSSSAAFQKLTADMTQKNIRGKTIGLMRFTSLVVGAVGSLLGGFVYQSIPHALAFAITIAIILAGVAYFAYFVKEPETLEL
jgi:MFS family permease